MPLREPSSAEGLPSAGELQEARWLALWNQLGAVGNGLQVFRRLSAAYAEPARVYHTADHIRDCLGQFDWSQDLAHQSNEVEAAIWFHDVVYLPGAPDNEDRSVKVADSILSDGGVPKALRRRIGELVLGTKHLAVSVDPDTQLLCDIDLSILGRDEPAFDEFERRIRREYAGVPEQMYRSGRSSVLEGFLRRPAIYQTKRFSDRYEDQARRNLKRVLTQLSG